MNDLPNYFLVDMPSDAPLEPKLVEAACDALKENQRRFLLDRSTESLITTLSRLAERWLDPEYEFRNYCLEHGPKQLGFSRPTLELGMDQLFREMTGENLQFLIEQDLGHWKRFDTPVGTKKEGLRNRSAMAHGPSLIGHIGAGRIPNSTIMSLVTGFLVRSSQFFKCSQKAVFFPRLFAHSLYDMEPKLAACLEIAAWPGGTEALELPLFQKADAISFLGSDKSLASALERIPKQTSVHQHGNKVSFAYISRDSMTHFNAKTIAESLALDIAAWDQSGCLSPHLAYVEKRGSVSPDHLASLVAEALEALEATRPRGEISSQEAARIRAQRSAFEIRAAHSKDTLLWQSDESTAWTVVYEDGALFNLSCLNRFFYIKSVDSLEEALAGAEIIRESISTIGVSLSEEESQGVVAHLARWGANRICPLGQMQTPHLSWRHDGRPSLADYVRWTDWEI